MKTKQSAGSKPKEKDKSELLACMPYLHGDVAGGEYFAACFYEYARESGMFQRASELQKQADSNFARLRGEGKSLNGIIASGTLATLEQVIAKLEAESDCTVWSVAHEVEIWASPSFPREPWTDLPSGEKDAILRHFPRPPEVVQPLAMNEVWLLESCGVFDQFKEMAKQQMQSKPLLHAEPAPPVFPIIEGWPRRPATEPWVHVLFTLDFMKAKKRLVEEFAAWLDLPEHKRRLEKFRHVHKGKTSTFKDRLKDLAAWRLYRELKYQGALDFANRHRLKDKNGKPRAFHDPRAGQNSKVALNQADLFKEESGFLKAKARALDFLAEQFPWEFGETAKRIKRFGEEFAEAVLKGTKISTGSS